jgi:hypothetical protein
MTVHVSHSFELWSNGDVKEVGQALPSRMFVRVLHEAELVPSLRQTPYSRPEVRAMFPNMFVPFGMPFQVLAWRMNPLLMAGNMTAVYHHKLWVANDNGFGDSTDPRANYFENKNLDKPLPKVEVITCGGNLLRVIGETRVKVGTQMEDAWLVETLDWRAPVPSLQSVLERPWLQTWAVDLTGDGLPSRFPQGKQPNGFQPGVVHPLLGTGQTAIPKWRCVRWLVDQAPDPYKVYLPA